MTEVKILDKSHSNGIWIFGDYRSPYQNFVTLQLLNKAKYLAHQRDSYVGIILIGYNTNQLIKDYSDYGADKIFQVDEKKFAEYSSDLFTSIITELAEEYRPEILLIPGSDFGREIAPRIALRLKTGLSSDCLSLEIDDNGNLIQVCTIFEADMLAEIITPICRPQIATVRAGVFKDPQKFDKKDAEIINIVINPEQYIEKVITESSVSIDHQTTRLERAENVICVGNGIAQKENIEKVEELAVLIDAEIGCTRPPIERNFYTNDRLIGQTGKSINPEFLFVIGASGATHLTTSFKNSQCIVAIDRNPYARIFNCCDIGIVGDAGPILTRLLKHLKE